MTLDTEISIDCFAGAGGASCGIELATGRSPAVAVRSVWEAWSSTMTDAASEEFVGLLELYS